MAVGVKLWGGGGAGGSLVNYGAPRAYAGGSGGFTSCLMSVSPGSVLTVIVGGGGASGASFGSIGTGGSGGGGNGR